MQLTQEKTGKYLLIKAQGRLDASWAEYFLEEVRTAVRNGEHHMIIDATELVFLSSAGIRSLLILHKELLLV
jgi:anti-anti-sigma factor